MYKEVHKPELPDLQSKHHTCHGAMYKQQSQITGSRHHPPLVKAGYARVAFGTRVCGMVILLLYALRWSHFRSSA